MSSAQTKGVFSDLDTANAALKRKCHLTFYDWENMHLKTKRAERDGKLEDVEPDVNMALRWKNPAGETRIVVKELSWGKGFMWVEKQDTTVGEVDGLEEEVRSLSEERKQQSSNLSTNKPPATVATMNAFESPSERAMHLLEERSYAANTQPSAADIFQWPDGEEENAGIQAHVDKGQVFYPPLPDVIQDMDFASVPEAAQSIHSQPDSDVRKHGYSPQAALSARTSPVQTPAKTDTAVFDSSGSSPHGMYHFGTGEADGHPFTPSLESRVKSESMSPTAAMQYRTSGIGSCTA